MPWAARLLVLQSANSRAVPGHACESWRWAFYLVVFPGIALGICSFFMREPPRGQADQGTQSRIVRWRDYLILLRTPSYVLCSLGMTAMTFAIGGIASGCRII